MAYMAMARRVTLSDALLRHDVFSPNEQLGVALICVGTYWCLQDGA